MEIKIGTAKLLDDYFVSKRKKETPRDYLGASFLGDECDRQIWYKYKLPRPEVDARRMRIFELGHMIEAWLIQSLKDAGLTVYDKDEAGKQFGFIDEEIAGHCDGVVVGLPESDKPHLLEMKGLAHDWFTKLQKSGLEAYSRPYWVQIHIYMYKLELEDCLFMAMNKDNCELYYERVKLDTRLAKAELLKGKEIARSVNEPERKYAKSNFFKCKMCDYQKECWKL